MNKKETANSQLASPWLRFGGWAVDFLLWVGAWLGAVWVAVSASEVTKLLDSLLWAVVGLGLLGTLGNLVATAGFTHWFGGTIGKLAFGIEVVDEQGKRLSFWRAIWREWFGKTVSGMALGLGFIWIFIEKDRLAESSNIQAGRRGWHDMMAGSKVVARRSGLLPLGILAALISAVVNLWGVSVVWSQGKENLPFYQSVVEDIKSEFAKEKDNNLQVAEEAEPPATPTLSPTPLPTLSQIIRPTGLPTKKPMTSGETTLLVTAVKEGGQPVENAHLILRNAEDLSFIGEGYTDRYGNFGFGKLAAGTYRIEAGLYGNLPYTKRVSVVSGQSNTAVVELLYDTQVAISGQVRFSDGNPIGGAQLRATKGGLCSGSGTGDATTDAGGRYELRVVGPGEYCVAITKMDWGSVDTKNIGDFEKGVKIASASGATVDFSLPRK